MSASTPLGERQRWLFERVTEPEEAYLAAHDVAEHVVGGKLAPRERLGVYRHGYVARLLECLEDDYPALRHALGQQAFDELCRGFIRWHPPRSPSLNHYGAPLAAHCAERREPWAGFAAELAALEWALVEAIHESEGQRLDGAALAQLSPEQWAHARLVPSPTLRLLDTQYPVGSYYQAYREGRARAEQVPALERSALAVCRRGLDVWRVRIELQLLPLLVALSAGTPLLAALESAASAAPGAPPASAEALQRAFRDWVACGLFSAVDREPLAGGAG